MVFRRALLVDDDPVFRTLAEDLFLDAGVTEIATAKDGAAAIDQLAFGLEPDLVVCDLNMPAHDGVSLIRTLAERKFRGKVLIVSGEDESVIHTVVKLARMQGLEILGSIRKPLTPERLSAALARAGDPFHAKSTASRAPVDENLLEHAIAHGGVQPFFQAKVTMRDRRIAGAEAVARIAVNSSELVSPVPYVELAEKNGRIDEFTFVLAGAVARHVRGFYIGIRPMPVSINISPLSLKRLDFPDQLALTMEAAGLPCSQVTLEITETRLLDYGPDALDIFARLRIKGFGLSIDDFGTGASNIDRLQMYPFNELKIDQSFTRNALTDSFARASVEMSVRLAKEMGLKVVAEGIETVEMWSFLADLGVDEGQGYLMAKPLPPAEFATLLRTGISTLPVKRSA